MSAKKKSGASASSPPPVARNRRARYDFEVLEKLEAGMVLRGSEVKSIRQGGISLDEAYVRILEGEPWLIDCTIPEWKQATLFGHEPKRPRKLLLHRREILRLHDVVRQKGLTMVPLAIYFKGPNAKCEIALVRGRKHHDKREREREKVAQKEMRDAL